MLFIDRRGEAAAALNDALSGTDYVARLEKLLSDAVDKRVVATSSFDGALHTALYLCEVGEGDYVFVPSFTFYSYIATVSNMGAVPIFLDCEPTTRCVSPLALETALVWAELQNKPPKAVIVDNAFGAVADYDVLAPLCKAWNVPMIELCADALCGEYKGKPCGANGDYGVFAFGAPGGGGAIAAGEDAGAARRFARYEYTDGINFDYRLNNFVASIDCALLPVLRRISERGKANLSAVCAFTDCVVPPVKGDAGRYALCRTDRAAELYCSGYTVKKPPPVHTLPQYESCYFFEHEKNYSVCLSLSDCVLIDMDISPLSRFRLIRKLK